MISDLISEQIKGFDDPRSVRGAFNHEELHGRWLELLMVWRKRAGEVYLEAVDRVRGDFSTPDQVWLARQTLEKVVIEEVGNWFAVEIKNAFLYPKSFSSSLIAAGFSLDDFQYFRVPISDLELKRLLFPEKFDLRKEARGIRPRRRLLFWYLEEEDPWID